MARARKIARDPQKAVAYMRCSTAEQGHSHLGMEAQRATIQAEAGRRGIQVARWIEDSGVSGKTLRRPGFKRAMEALAEEGAGVLIVSKLDRLTRSVHDASGLMQEAEREGWALIAVDVAVDMTTPAGRAMAHLLAVFAEFERQAIAVRTREALAEKRRRGEPLGRPRTLRRGVAKRIASARDSSGATWQAIADDLNRDRVPTAQGGARWYPATVRKVYLSRQVRAA